MQALRTKLRRQVMWPLVLALAAIALAPVLFNYLIPATTLWMSRMNTDVPIYALTPEVETRRKLTLFRGVYPVNFKTTTK